MSKSFLRLVGGAMALVGAAILAFAISSYVSQRQLEARLEAFIPGQTANASASTTPIFLAPATSLPTMDATRLSPSVTPFPTHATPVQPDPTTAANLVRTPTAINLRPRTPATSDELTNSLKQPTNAATPLAPNAPTISSLQGTPRGYGSAATRLVIPKLNMDLPIKPADYATFQQNGQLVSDWVVPYDAAGHLITTAQPGEIGNAVLSGHHNLTAPNTFGLGTFAGLWNLAVGDEVRLSTEDGKTQLWRVTESFPIKEGGEPLAVRIQHAQQIMADSPQPLLTLLTCWNGKISPLSGNTYRWIVRAELVNIN